MSSPFKETALGFDSPCIRRATDLGIESLLQILFTAPTGWVFELEEGVKQEVGNLGGQVRILPITIAKRAVTPPPTKCRVFLFFCNNHTQKTG